MGGVLENDVKLLALQPKKVGCALSPRFTKLRLDEAVRNMIRLLIRDVGEDDIACSVEHVFLICSHKRGTIRPVLCICAGIDGKNEIDIPFLLKKRP